MIPQNIQNDQNMGKNILKFKVETIENRLENRILVSHILQIQKIKETLSFLSCTRMMPEISTLFVTGL